MTLLALALPLMAMGLVVVLRMVEDWALRDSATPGPRRTTVRRGSR